MANERNIMSYATPTHTLPPSALGCFDKLPAELRLHIYGFVLPPTYQQQFRIDREQGWISERLDDNTKPIGLLYTSKKIRAEAVPAISKGHICRINLDNNGLTVNMPWQDVVLGSRMALPPCSGIELLVQIPNPRSAADFLNMRQNVAILVRWLVGQETPISRISARLYGESAEAWEPTYNDVAMLLGPLGFMRGIDNPQVICISSFKPGSAGRLASQQCQAIESAMRSLENQSGRVQGFGLQQMLIDIKLELVLYLNEQGIAALRNHIRGTSVKPVLGQARCTRLLTALSALGQLLQQVHMSEEEREAARSNGLYPSHGPSVPDLRELQTTAQIALAKTEVPTEVPQALTNRILNIGTYDLTTYMMWASGCLTRVNPYY